jgi:hypothetical protein
LSRKKFGPSTDRDTTGRLCCRLSAVPGTGEANRQFGRRVARKKVRVRISEVVDLGIETAQRIGMHAKTLKGTFSMTNSEDCWWVVVIQEPARYVPGPQRL